MGRVDCNRLGLRRFSEREIQFVIVEGKKRKLL